MITKELFIKIIEALRDQSDEDNKRAQKLSDIYGSDINPNDNSLLTDALFEVLKDKFTDNGIVGIGHFCFEQDYGRIINLSAGDFWEQMLRDMEVNF